MSTNKRFLADMAERAVRAFILGFGLATAVTSGQSVEFDNLFTMANLKGGILAVVLSLVGSVMAKGIGNPASASVLPPPAVEPPPTEAPPVEPPPEAPAYLVAAVFSQRLNAWSTVYLHPEINPAEGSFVLTTETHEGLPVAVYQPGEAATHTPVGPTEMSALGLRPKLPEPF